MFVPSQRLPSVSRLQNQSRGKRSRKRRLGLESIERRMVLSAVHGASAADAAAEGVDEVSQVAVGGQDIHSLGDASADSTACLADHTRLSEWASSMLPQVDELEALREQLETLEERLKELAKEWRKLSREFDEIEQKLAERDPPPSGEERAKLEKRSKEIRDRGDDIEKEQDAIESEIDEIKEKIEKLQKELEPDQDGDGDALPDDASARDADAWASLLAAGDLFEVCLPPIDWNAIALDLASQGAPDHGGDQDSQSGNANSAAPLAGQSPVIAPQIADVIRRLVLVAQLGHAEYAAREEASLRLIAEGEDALPIIRAAKDVADLEVSHRAERIEEIIIKNAITGLVNDLAGGGDAADQATARLQGYLRDPNFGALARTTIREAAQDAPPAVREKALQLLLSTRPVQGGSFVPPSGGGATVPFPARAGG